MHDSEYVLAVFVVVVVAAVVVAAAVAVLLAVVAAAVLNEQLDSHDVEVVIDRVGEMICDSDSNDFVGLTFVIAAERQALNVQMVPQVPDVVDNH